MKIMPQYGKWNLLMVCRCSTSLWFDQTAPGRGELRAAGNQLLLECTGLAVRTPRTHAACDPSCPEDRWVWQWVATAVDGPAHDCPGAAPMQQNHQKGRFTGQLARWAASQHVDGRLGLAAGHSPIWMAHMVAVLGLPPDRPKRLV